MKTNNIGEFIQLLRKEKGLTQKELAEIICMSDKTISKWENGNSLPDTSMLLPLCKALDVSVNELLSCERIPPEDYSMKAEETIMTLIKENENSKKGNIISKIIGMILLAVSVFLLFMSSPSGYGGITIYPYIFIDIPSLVLLVFLASGIILATGVREKKGILVLLSKIVIPIGVVISLASAMIILSTIGDPNAIGPSMAIVILSLFYSFLIKIVVEVMIAKER